MVNDPMAQAIIKDLVVPAETIKEMSDSFLSVRVRAVKPED
jgi:hypothetical protein